MSRCLHCSYYSNLKHNHRNCHNVMWQNTNQVGKIGNAK
jgi:hypothetical protein